MNTIFSADRHNLINPFSVVGKPANLLLILIYAFVAWSLHNHFVFNAFALLKPLMKLFYFS